jgi:hypothetical protein
MKFTHAIKSLLILTVLSVASFAQNPTKWSIESDAKGTSVKAGEAITVLLKAEVEGDWHLYSLQQPKGGPIATTIKAAEGTQFEISGKIVETPAPKTEPDPNFVVDGKPLDTKFFTQRAEFSVPLNALADVSGDSIALDVRFQLCNDTVCLPPRTKRVTFAGESDVGRTAFSSQPTASLGLRLARHNTRCTLTAYAVCFPDDPDHGFVFHESFGRQPSAVDTACHRLFARDRCDIYARRHAACNICGRSGHQSFRRQSVGEYSYSGHFSLLRL